MTSCCSQLIKFFDFDTGYCREWAGGGGGASWQSPGSAEGGALTSDGSTGSYCSGRGNLRRSLSRFPLSTYDPASLRDSPISKLCSLGSLLLALCIVGESRALMSALEICLCPLTAEKHLGVRRARLGMNKVKEQGERARLVPSNRL